MEPNSSVIGLSKNSLQGALIETKMQQRKMQCTKDSAKKDALKKLIIQKRI